MLQIDRRSLIKLVSVGGVATFLVGYNYPRLFFENADESVSIENKLLDFVKNERSISRTVGRIFLEEKYSNTILTPNIIIKRLVGALSLSENDLKDRLANLVVEDFNEGRTWTINGWELSKTECQLSALSYLVNGEVAETDSDSGVPQSLSEVPYSSLGRVEGWGPKRGQAGTPFNEQPSGNSSIWLKFDGLERGVDYALYFSETEMGTTVHFSRNLITADLSPQQVVDLTSSGGTREIHIVDLTNFKKQLIGEYTIDGIDLKPNLKDAEQLLAGMETSSLINIDAWGPKKGVSGEPFNLQPNGDSALWIKYHGRGGSNLKVFFGSAVMDTKLHEPRNLITASISHKVSKKQTMQGKSPSIYIVDMDKNKKQLIGIFDVIDR